MSDRFNHIDTKNEKIINIINSAFEEFGIYDLEKASLNNIIKRANLSKGVFYYYFKDKKELFDFLLYFSIKVITDELDKDIDWDDSDFFNRLRNSVIVVFETFHDYPYLLDFFYKYSGKRNRQSPEHQIENIAPGITDKFYQYNLDFSKVREGVDTNKMMTVSKYMINGLTNEIFNKIKISGDMVVIEQIMKEVDMYINFLREQFYISEEV